MTKQLLLPVILIFFINACTPQITSGVRMMEANQLYENKKYTEAAAVYQMLIDDGVQDGTLYYNLGNAYFKSGDLGRAILNYRRAELFLPRDQDISANLQIARSHTRDGLETKDSSVGIVLFRRILERSITLNESASITLALWNLLCVLILISIFWKHLGRLLRFGIATVVVLLLLSMISLGFHVLDEYGYVPAVIVAEAIDVHSGPNNDYIIQFTLHAGAEVRIIEERNGWIRIIIPGDLQGWLPEDAADTL